MRTGLLTAKIRHGFDHLDVDGDGELTEQDHVLCGQRAAASLGHVPGSADEKRLVDAYVAIWRDLHLPYLPEGRTSISRDEFVASTATLVGDPDAAAATLGAVARAFLEIADTDQDGGVSPTEFRLFQRGHFPKMTDAEIDEAFAHLDTDGNGHLSAEEFTRAITEFWSSEDPDAPGNWWMGRPDHLFTATEG